MIMERYLTNAMPKSKKFCLKRINRYTGYKYYSLRNYINSDLYTISKDAIYITDDIQLLSNKSKHYIETLIKNIVCPSQYKDNHCIANCLKLFDDSYFTEEEKNFVKQMTNELFLILDESEISYRTSLRDLYHFNYLNRRPFLFTARQVYNDILQKKICAGDMIIEYIKTYITDMQVTGILEKSCKYDYFFDSNGILKCD